MSTERKVAPQGPLAWYREPWPWILMAGPAIVVVAGLATAVIAVKTDDGLVSEDYYKRGMAINRTIAREERARDLGLSATVQFADGHDRVRVLITSGAPPAEPPTLTLVNATRAELDRSVRLRATAPGVYEGVVKMPARGVWRIRLEDAASTWRLAGRWRAGEAAAALAPAL